MAVPIYLGVEHILRQVIHTCPVQVNPERVEMRVAGEDLVVPRGL